MALSPIAASAPLETYTRINAAISALNTLIQNFVTLSGQVGGNASAVAAIQQALSAANQAIADIQTNLATKSTITDLDAVQHSVTLKANSADLTSVQQALLRLIDEVSNNLLNVRGDLQNSVNSLLDSVALKANNDSLTLVQDSLLALIGSVNSALDHTQGDLAAGLATKVSQPVFDAQILALFQSIGLAGNTFAGSEGRPGEASLAFMPVAIGGPVEAMPVLAPTDFAFGTDGFVVRRRGQSVTCTRRAAVLEIGRAYRARFVVRRRANTSDPANDGVRCAVLWLDQVKNALLGNTAFTVLADIDTLVTATGRREVSVVIARSAGPRVNVVAPPGAVHARLYVQTYGVDGVTDLEVIDLDDITNATILPAVSADALGRLDAIESGGYGDRIEAVEAAVGTPLVLSFRSIGDASAATIPPSVTGLRLLGANTAGDGDGRDYRRVSTLMPGASGFVSQDGATWQRVEAWLKDIDVDPGNPIAAAKITVTAAGSDVARPAFNKFAESRSLLDDLRTGETDIRRALTQGFTIAREVRVPFDNFTMSPGLVLPDYGVLVSPSRRSQIRPTGTAGDIITFGGYSGVSDVGLVSPNYRSAGIALKMVRSGCFADNIYLERMFDGWEVSGTLCNLKSIEARDFGNAGDVMRIQGSPFAVSIHDFKADHPTPGKQPRANLHLLDANDVSLSDFNLIRAAMASLLIDPDVGQYVASFYCNNGFFDTSGFGGLLRPRGGANGGKIRRCHFRGVWFYATVAAAVTLDTDTYGGNITGTKFIDCEVSASATDGFDIMGAGTSWTDIEGGLIASCAGAAISVTKGAGATHLSGRLVIGPNGSGSEALNPNGLPLYTDATASEVYAHRPVDLRFNQAASITNGNPTVHIDTPFA